MDFEIKITSNKFFDKFAPQGSVVEMMMMMIVQLPIATTKISFIPATTSKQ